MDASALLVSQRDLMRRPSFGFWWLSARPPQIHPPAALDDYPRLAGRGERKSPPCIDGASTMLNHFLSVVCSTVGIRKAGVASSALDWSGTNR